MSIYISNVPIAIGTYKLKRILEKKIKQEISSIEKEDDGVYELKFNDDLLIPIVLKRLLDVEVDGKKIKIVQKSRVLSEDAKQKRADGKLSTVFLWNLPEGVHAKDLKELLSIVGPIIHFRFREGTRDAFCTFKESHDVNRALVLMNQIPLAKDVFLNCGLWNNDYEDPEKIIVEESMQGAGDNVRQVKDQFSLVSKDRKKLIESEIAKISAYPNQEAYQRKRKKDKELIKVSHTSEKPAKNVLLMPMFDPEEESDDKWEEEIERDVLEVASTFGKIENFKLIPDKEGKIVIRYETISEAQKAREEMHKQFYNYREISASFLQELDYMSLDSK